MPTKTIFHSALKKLGPVRVTVQSDVLKSKFPGKPDYVCLNIDGTDWNYSLECPACGDVFHNQKGKTFTIIADGGGKDKPDTATITYVGESARDGDLGPATAPQPASARRTPTPHNTAAPVSAPRATAPAAPARPATPPVTLHHGAQVGMAVNNAVTYMIAEGIPFDANEIYNRASDLVRISDALENGHMAPKFSERKGNQ